MSAAGNKGIHIILMLAAVFFTLCFYQAHAENEEFVQPQAHFERALRNLSSSAHIILFTLVDDKTGETHSGCLTAPLLLGAIIKEHELNDEKTAVQEAIQIALANPTHVFHFSKQAALDNVPLSDIENRCTLRPQEKAACQLAREYQHACSLIREGNSVIMGDRRGVFVEPVSDEDKFSQPQAHFERALRNLSPSPHFIFLTAVNEQTGETHTGCMSGSLLVVAISTEEELGSDDAAIKKATEIALANKSHIYHFSKQTTMNRYLWRFFSGERACTGEVQSWAECWIVRQIEKACALVREGKSVRWMDWTNELVVD